MKCQRCHKNEATTQLIQQVSGQLPQTVFLCDACAKALGMNVGALSHKQAYTPNPFTMMAQLFDSSLGFGGPGSVQKTRVCEKCNLTFDEFKKSGLFGCSSCYEAFSDEINPVFCRFQMGQNHVGRSLGLDSEGQKPDTKEQPVKTSSLHEEDVASIEKRHMKRQVAEKKKAMAAAVEKEDYRKAARLRDEIHQIEEKTKEEST